MLPRAVIDTSCLVPNWSRRLLVAMAAAGRFQPIWSEWVIAETWRVLTYLRLSRGHSWPEISAQANQMMRVMLPVMETVSVRALPPSPPWETASDPDDWPIWEAARASGATYVVSDNIADFPPLRPPEEHAGHQCRRHVHERVEYLTCGEFATSILLIDPSDFAGRTARRPGTSGRTCPGAAA